MRSFISSPTQGAVPLTSEVVLLITQGPQDQLIDYGSDLSFLHLRLLLDGTLSVTISHVQTLEFALSNLCVTPSQGLARAVAYGVSARGGLTRYGFSISENAQTGCAVSYTKLAEDVALEGCVFDGFRGRLCFPNHPHIEILNYV